MGFSLLSLFCPHMTAQETPPVVVIPGGAHFRWSNPFLLYGFPWALSSYPQVW